MLLLHCTCPCRLAHCPTAATLCHGALSTSLSLCRIHDADLYDIGIMEGDRVDLPPASGDMHKCIEHVHGTVTPAFSM